MIQIGPFNSWTNPFPKCLKSPRASMSEKILQAQPGSEVSRFHRHRILLTAALFLVFSAALPQKFLFLFTAVL
jgi:hypothetical protein